MAIFISNPLFRARGFGTFHPLSIPRHATVIGLCIALGWLREEEIVTCPFADRPLLERFHTTAYLDAFEAAARDGRASAETRKRFGIGTAECPLFEGIWERAAATVGGAVLAARCALDGAVAFHPAGGTHHGRPDRAVGFCYFNDPVFAILTLLDAGLDRVLYVDLDAHHGDGVQDAFAAEARVSTISIHEQGRWPYTGAVSDRGGGRSRNLPVPKGLNDAEFACLMERAVLPAALAWRPEALVVTCGADALNGDPLSSLALSNGALWRAVEELIAIAPRAVVLGGGGYNPWTAARCWAGLWARLADKAIPARLPAKAARLLEALDCDLVDEDEIDPAWLTAIADTPNTGPVRNEIRRLAAMAAADSMPA